MEEVERARRRRVCSGFGRAPVFPGIASVEIVDQTYAEVNKVISPINSRCRVRAVCDESEAKVREALERLMAGKTCLMISHDLQSIADADMVLVLEEGRIVERGTHAELLVHGGLYAKLYEEQFRAAEEAPVGPAASGIAGS